MSEQSPADRKERSEFVQGVERGLSILAAFSAERPAMTLSEVAAATALTRPTARRFLLTLQQLGYVRSDGRLFSLTPRVLRLGYAYLSSLNLPEVAQPFLEEVAGRAQESASVGMLDGDEVVYVARASTGRLMSTGLNVGARLPAYCTSTGRVLLAALPPAELEAFLERGPFEQRTERTITDPNALRATMEQVRAQGWSIIDQELERGVRAVAAPIEDASGEVIASVQIFCPVGRVGATELRSEFLPLVRRAAQDISSALGSRRVHHM